LTQNTSVGISNKYDIKNFTALHKATWVKVRQTAKHIETKFWIWNKTYNFIK